MKRARRDASGGRVRSACSAYCASFTWADPLHSYAAPKTRGDRRSLANAAPSACVVSGMGRGSALPRPCAGATATASRHGHAMRPRVRRTDAGCAGNGPCDRRTHARYAGMASMRLSIARLICRNASTRSANARVISRCASMRSPNALGICRHASMHSPNARVICGNASMRSPNARVTCRNALMRSPNGPVICRKALMRSTNANGLFAPCFEARLRTFGSFKRPSKRRSDPCAPCGPCTHAFVERIRDMRRCIPELGEPMSAVDTCEDPVGQGVASGQRPSIFDPPRRSLQGIESRPR